MNDRDTDRGPHASASDTARARAERAVHEHATNHRGVELRELGGGLDHRTFLLSDLVVRVAGRATVTREADLLHLVAPRVSVPVPAPRFDDPHRGVLGYPLVPGRPLLGRTPPPGAAAHLGRVLRELHRIDLAEVADLVPVDHAAPEAWLEELTGPPELLRALHTDRPRRTHELVLAHADLGAEHILEQQGRLTGIIDWADAAVTDPALDFARLHRDFGPAFLDDALLAYGQDSRELRQRIKFFARCAALDDLAYGRDSGREEYRWAAERSLSWLFPPP